MKLADESMPVTQPQFEVNPTENELVVVVSRLVEHRKRFAKVIGAAFLLITAVAFLIPNEYQSTARLMPPEKQSLGGLGAMLAAAGEDKAGSAITNLAMDSLGLKNSGAVYVGVLKSVSVQDDLVDHFDLQKVYHKRYRQDARERLSSQTDIFEDRKSGIITLTVTDRSPERAQLMATEYVRELNEVTAQLDSSAAHRERLFIEGRLKSAKGELADADKALSEFSSKNLTLDVKEQAKAMVESAATLEGELIATESQLSGLQQIYTSNNVRVRSLQARVDMLKHKLSELRGADSPDAAADSNDAGDVGISISKLPVLGVTYYDLYRRAKIEEVVFETLTKQYELARIEEAKELPTIKLIDSPLMPEEKSGPPRTAIIVIGTLFCAAMVVLWVWGRYRWTKLDPEDPRKSAMIETVAILATVAHPNWLRLTAFWRKKFPGREQASRGEDANLPRDQVR